MLHCTRINWLLVFFAHPDVHPDKSQTLNIKHSNVETEKKVKTYSCCGMLTAAFDFLEEKLRTVPVFGHYSTNSCQPPQPSSATLAPHAEQVSYQRCCSELAPISRLWVLSLSKWEQLERGTLSLSPSIINRLIRESLWLWFLTSNFTFRKVYFIDTHHLFAQRASVRSRTLEQF